MVTTNLIDATGIAGRYRRPALVISPGSISGSSESVARIVDVAPRTISPVVTPVMGDVRPHAALGMTALCGSPMAWHQTTTSDFGGQFAGLAVDIKLRVGPPPPRRPSV